MSSSQNPFFTNEELSPHEQYIMFVGYMERVFDEMKAQEKSDIEKQINELVMVILNKKVVEICFPDFGIGENKKSNAIAFEEIAHIAKSRYKLRIGKRIKEMLEEIRTVIDKHKDMDMNNPDKAEAILRELFDV